MACHPFLCFSHVLLRDTNSLRKKEKKNPVYGWWCGTLSKYSRLVPVPFPTYPIILLAGTNAPTPPPPQLPSHSTHRINEKMRAQISFAPSWISVRSLMWDILAPTPTPTPLENVMKIYSSVFCNVANRQTDNKHTDTQRWKHNLRSSPEVITCMSFLND